MGKLILCSGVRANKPYIITSTGFQIFSIEELCYYVYQNIYSIEEDFFTDDLLRWIEMELQLKDRADKLNLLIRKKADWKTIITTLMCSCDYYSESEILNLLKTVDEIAKLSPVKKSLIQAKLQIKNNNYKDAEAKYQGILNRKDREPITPEEYGDILHELAIIKSRRVGLSEAAELLREAYERNHKEETLRQFLMAIKLTKPIEVFEDLIKEYQVSDELYQKISKDSEDIVKEAERTEEMKQIHLLKELKEQGNFTAFMNLAEDGIQSWIRDYRRGI